MKSSPKPPRDQNPPILVPEKLLIHRLQHSSDIGEHTRATRPEYHPNRGRGDGERDGAPRSSHTHHSIKPLRKPIFSIDPLTATQPQLTLARACCRLLLRAGRGDRCPTEHIDENHLDSQERSSDKHETSFLSRRTAILPSRNSMYGAY